MCVYIAINTLNGSSSTLHKSLSSSRKAVGLSTKHSNNNSDHYRHQRSHTDPTTVRTLRSMIMTKPPDHNINVRVLYA